MAKQTSKASHAISLRNTIEFDEIPNWQAFEDLVANYFRGTKGQKSIADVEVDHSGVGPDGGRDIFITFKMSDSIVSFDRKWVVQCKFYDTPVSKRELSDINIPTLIHEYGADGYLLVCKEQVTSTVSAMFENLRKQCRMHYNYDFWTGSRFKSYLNLLPSKSTVIKTHFPAYYRFLQLKGKGRV
jgi:hypothetical protein